MLDVPTQFDDMNVGILLHDAQTGDVLYANEFAEGIYGYSTKELTEMDVVDFSSDSFSESEAVQRIKAAADGHSQQFEWQNKRPTGELFWVEVRLSPVNINKTTYVVAIVRDITDYKLNLRHLRVLTRITRHNFRNKLNIIEGYFEQIEQKSDNTDLINKIRRSISDLLGLTGWIDTIRSVSGPESAAEIVDVSRLVSEITDPYRQEYSNIKWQVKCEKAHVTAHSTLRTAINELIDNAVRHNPHEDLKITIEVTEHPADNQICICITDTGQPIPEIEIEPLVSGYDPDPLEHGDRIGLWEVQTIVNAHQGRLSVVENSTVQKTIKITLPRAN